MPQCLKVGMFAAVMVSGLFVVHFGTRLFLENNAVAQKATVARPKPPTSFYHIRQYSGGQVVGQWFVDSWSYGEAVGGISGSGISGSFTSINGVATFIDPVSGKQVWVSDYRIEEYVP